jgi:hypothetical protein
MIKKEKVLLMMMTPLITFDNTTHLNAILKNLEFSIRDSDKYEYDVLICFLDGEKVGQVQSKEDKLKDFLLYEDEDVDYFKNIKEENLKNINKLNVPHCFSNFNYKVFTKTEGYGLQHFIVLDELLETDEILSYDYLIWSSDAAFCNVPNFYDSWIKQFEEINSRRNIPLLLSNPFWLHKGEFPQKIGNRYHTPQHENIKWVMLDHGFDKMIFKPKNYFEIKKQYELPGFSSDKLISNFSRDRVDFNDILCNYEAPFPALYHYIFYYLRESNDYQQKAPLSIELYSAIDNHTVNIDTGPFRVNIIEENRYYHEHIGAYSYFNLNIKEIQFRLKSWKLKSEVHKKYYEVLLSHQDKYYRLFDEFVEYVGTQGYSDVSAIKLQNIREKFLIMHNQHIALESNKLYTELFYKEHYRER